MLMIFPHKLIFKEKVRAFSFTGQDFTQTQLLRAEKNTICEQTVAEKCKTLIKLIVMSGMHSESTHF